MLFMARELEIQRMVKAGWQEEPGAIHMGHGVWIVRLNPPPEPEPEECSPLTAALEEPTL